MSKRKVVDSNLTPIFDFSPQKIDGVQDLLNIEKVPSAFSVHPIIEETLKIAVKKKQEEEKLISERVLEKLEIVQKEAYQAGFDLGKAEGREEAFLKTERELQGYVLQLSELVENLRNIRTDWIQQQEQIVIQTIFLVAKKIAGYEVSANPKATFEMVKQLVDRLQTEESIRLEISPDLLDYFTQIKNQVQNSSSDSASNDKEAEFLKQIKIMPNPQLNGGGCILSTNLVELDSQFETRAQELWSRISELFAPHKKEFISVGSSKNEDGN